MPRHNRQALTGSRAGFANQKPRDRQHVRYQKMLNLEQQNIPDRAPTMQKVSKKDL
jgi:hypothetical protein